MTKDHKANTENYLEEGEMLPKEIKDTKHNCNVCGAYLSKINRSL